jgi:hypothetical protein
MGGRLERETVRTEKGCSQGITNQHLLVESTRVKSRLTSVFFSVHQDRHDRQQGRRWSVGK